MVSAQTVEAMVGLAIAAEANEYEASCRTGQIGSEKFWASVENRLIRFALRETETP